MSFFRSLIGKGNPEKPAENPGSKPVPASEAAAKVSPSSASGTNPRVNPIAGKDAAAPASRKPKLPTKEQRDQFFNAMKPKDARLARAAVEQGYVTEEMIRDAMKNEAGATLQKTLVQTGMMRDIDVLDALSIELGMERVSLSNITVTPELIAQVPKKTAKDFRIFPVGFNDSEIHVALADPLNIQIMDDLQRLLGKTVVGFVCAEDEIDRFFKRFYESNATTEMLNTLTENLQAKEAEDHDAQTIEITEDENAPPVVKFVDLIFKQGVHDRASDIHIEPNRSGLGIRFRIDGVLHEVPSPPKKWQNAIISRLKVLSNMDLAEKRIPQDGRIKLVMPDRKLDLRVNTLPSIYGETIVMRILDQSSVLLGLEDVGFMPDNITLFNSLIRTPTGVILMTGPTGSGKTTTLYSALSTLNSPEVKIVTIENPVEYMLEGVVQVQVNEEVGLDFKSGLRSILRQSPDVLLVGEMRDLETAEIGIRAALTGHLVFSTLHTNDAPSAPGRLVDMGVKPFLVASSLQAIIAQRLVRRLCPSCKQPAVLTDEELNEIQATDEERAARETFSTMGPKGCERCSGKGYRGRTAIHEIMVVNSRLRQLIIKGESGFRMKKIAIRGGMRSLRMDGWQKVKLGMTSVEEILRATQND